MIIAAPVAPGPVRTPAPASAPAPAPAFMPLSTAAADPNVAPLPVGDGEEPHADDLYGRAMRHDGWTPPRQRRFLEFIADGHIVDHAARMVGLSATSAYAFRRRPAGAAFALGWRAANLVARDHLADLMLDRARHGTTETITRADGSSIERHRISDRLGLQLLARLDRQAEAATAGEASAARLVAGDFDPFLDLVGADAGPARAGLFLVAHGAAEADAPVADLAALARADRVRRAVPGDAAADLDPASRHGWTAVQWLRAEAVGIVALAPDPAAPDAPATGSQLPQLHAAPPPVWWCDAAQDYRTHFPPPADFDGEEEGAWEEDDYQRPLSPAERRLIGAPDFDPDAALARADAERDAWFATHSVALNAPERAGDQAAEPSPTPEQAPRAEHAPDRGQAPEPKQAQEPEQASEQAPEQTGRGRASHAATPATPPPASVAAAPAPARPGAAASPPPSASTPPDAARTPTPVAGSDTRPAPSQRAPARPARRQPAVARPGAIRPGSAATSAAASAAASVPASGPASVSIA